MAWATVSMSRPEPTTRSSDASALQPPLARLFALFLASRLFIYVVAGLALWWAPKGFVYTEPATILDWFIRWDAGWYIGIVDHGYSFTAPGEPTNVVFFPAYPLLVWLVSLNGLIPTPIAGYVTSFACSWVACVWLWRAVAREWGDAKIATLAVVFLVCGPVSFSSRASIPRRSFCRCLSDASIAPARAIGGGRRSLGSGSG